MPDHDAFDESAQEQSVSDLLHATVPIGDPHRRDALEQRLMDRLHNTERQSHMSYVSTYAEAAPTAPRRMSVSASLFMITAVVMLGVAAMAWGRFIPPRGPSTLPMAAGGDTQEQEATAVPRVTTVPLVTATPTPASAQPHSPVVFPSAVPTMVDLDSGMPDGDVILSIASDRLAPLDAADGPYTAGQPLNLYIALALFDATDLDDEGEARTAQLVTNYVPVVTYVVPSTADDALIFTLPLKQGLMLDWLLTNTRAFVYYEVSK